VDFVTVAEVGLLNSWEEHQDCEHVLGRSEVEHWLDSWQIRKGLSLDRRLSALN
jgi:hypothetical protein